MKKMDQELHFNGHKIEQLRMKFVNANWKTRSDYVGSEDGQQVGAIIIANKKKVHKLNDP